MDWLKGKRTYLVAVGLAISVFALNVGWIDLDLYEQITVLLTGAGLAALRAGVAK